MTPINQNYYSRRTTPHRFSLIAVLPSMGLGGDPTYGCNFPGATTLRYCEKLVIRRCRDSGNAITLHAGSRACRSQIDHRDMPSGGCKNFIEFFACGLRLCCQLRSPAQQFFHPRNDVRRLVDDFFGELFQFFAADRVDDPFALLEIRQHAGIFKRTMISVAQDLHPLWRHRVCRQSG